MAVIIYDEKGKEQYAIKAYRGNTCFQLYKMDTERIAETGGRHYKAGDTVGGGWKPVECYPSTLAQAFRYIHERMMIESIKPERGFKAAVAHAEALEKQMFETAKVVALDLGGDKPEDFPEEV